MTTSYKPPVSLGKLYVRVLTVYAGLFAVSAMHGLALEDRYPAGLAILDHASEIGAASLALYLLGVYLLRFPYGTLLLLCEPDQAGAWLQLLSGPANAFFVAYLFHRISRWHRAAPLRRAQPPASS